MINVHETGFVLSAFHPNYFAKHDEPAFINSVILSRKCGSMREYIEIVVNDSISNFYNCLIPTKPIDVQEVS